MRPSKCIGHWDRVCSNQPICSASATIQLRGLPYVREHPLPVHYKRMRLDCGYRIDLLVDGAVVVELKAVDRLVPVHDAQLITYLRLGGWKVGLLINFNVAVLRDGIRRRVLGLQE